MYFSAFNLSWFFFLLHAVGLVFQMNEILSLHVKLNHQQGFRKCSGRDNSNQTLLLPSFGQEKFDDIATFNFAV